MVETVSPLQSHGPLEQQIAELIATYEIAMDRLVKREKSLEEQHQASEKLLQNQLDKINSLMNDLREVMTEAGAARWRLSAQEALRLGDLQLQTLKKVNEDTKNHLQESCSRFERASNSTVKNVHEIMDNLKLDEFKTYVEKSYEEVSKTSSSALEKISTIFNWFQWKNMALALGLSIVAAVVIGLYIDDEWPWELHSNVVKERSAGEALMNAWPHLDKADQAFLENKILHLKNKGN
jgi:hypothetical protein